MLRVLPYVIILCVVIYALVDCAQTPDAQVKFLPKPVWIVLIILFSLIGALAWLVVGHDRQTTAGTGGRWPTGGARPEPTRPRYVAPDDDPDFLAQLGRDNPPPDEPRTPAPKPSDEEQDEDGTTS